MRKIFFVIMLTVLLLLTAACQRNEDPADVPDDTPPKEEAQISMIEDESITDMQLNGEVYGTITISRITLQPADNAALSAINADLKLIEQTYINDRIDEEEAQFAADPTVSFTHELNFELFYHDDELISVIAEEYDNQANSAHPITAKWGYVYDAHSGERLGMSALLGTDYQEAVVAKIMRQINSSGESDNYYPDLERLLYEYLVDGKWWADAENVYIVYHPYEIAAYAVGQTEFIIPRSE